MDSIMKWQVKFRAYVSELNIPRDDYRGIMEYIEEVPTQPEIIRCEDCRWWERESICEGHCLEIDLHHVDEDHYCSYAERRTDG